MCDTHKRIYGRTCFGQACRPLVFTPPPAHGVSGLRERADEGSDRANWISLSGSGERAEVVSVDIRLPERSQEIQEAVRATLRWVGDLDASRAAIGGTVHQDRSVDPLRGSDAVVGLPRQGYIGRDRPATPIRHFQRNSFHPAVTL
jgi:hypothetical protein